MAGVGARDASYRPTGAVLVLRYHFRPACRFAAL